MSKNNKKTTQKKRSGLHHHRSKHYHNVYLPYLPALLILIVSIIISGLRLPIGNGAVLAYATEMSSGGLLSSTNQRRGENGKGSLGLNSKLNAAAQAKANDMIARDYWSHNTPDGKEPWVFIGQQGYSYTKAGENLAYGFSTSSQTITGWMNSPTHKANMLDAAFTEVGFGFANGSNYQGGPETVVVAMYGQPQTLGASSAAPAPVASAPKTVAQASPPARATGTPAKPNVSPSTTTPTPTPAPVVQSTAPETTPAPVNTEQAVPATTSEKPVTRIQAMTGGRAPWSLFAVGLTSGMAVTLLFISHSLRLHKLLRAGGKLLRGGERFVLHHPAFDATMISILALTTALAENIGTIL